jgi:hypothetical protein
VTEFEQDDRTKTFRDTGEHKADMSSTMPMTGSAGVYFRLHEDGAVGRIPQLRAVVGAGPVVSVPLPAVQQRSAQRGIVSKCLFNSYVSVTTRRVAPYKS